MPCNQEVLARTAARELGDVEARRNTDLVDLQRKDAVHEAELEVERARLEAQLKEVHEHVQSVGSELQAAMAEASVASATTEKLRNEVTTSELREKEMAHFLQASEVNAKRAEAELQAALLDYRHMEEEAKVAAADQDARLADAEGERNRLWQEAEEFKRSGAALLQSAQDEVKRLGILEAQLRSSTQQVETMAEAARLKLEKEGNQLEQRVAELGEKRNGCISRVQQVQSVLQIVEPEHARSEARKNAELQAIRASTEARNSEHRQRIWPTTRGLCSASRLHRVEVNRGSLGGAQHGSATTGRIPT